MKFRGKVAEKNMKNTIKRDTIFIEALTLTKSSAFGAGECIGNYKKDGKWITKDSNGKEWQNLARNLRNENFYQFRQQYSMGEIVQYLRNKCEDYYTVAYEFLQEAVETTFEEIQVRCIDDIYQYVTKNLL